MHSFYSYLEENPAKSMEPVFHEMSHGESFLEVLANRWGLREQVWDELELVQNWRNFLHDPGQYLRHVVT